MLPQEYEERRKLGKAHLKRAILGQEEALRLHALGRALRRVDLLQAVLGQALRCSLTRYSELDLEDDFFEATEAPDIQREQPGPLGQREGGGRRLLQLLLQMNHLPQPWRPQRRRRAPGKAHAARPSLLCPVYTPDSCPGMWVGVGGCSLGRQTPAGQPLGTGAPPSGGGAARLRMSRRGRYH